MWNNKRGRNPRLTFRAAHLLTSQLPLRLGGKAAAERDMLRATDTLLGALGGVFHLDPVPQQMRQYVPEQDVVLRRNAENLSATVARLHDQRGARFDALVDAIRGLPEYALASLGVGRGQFGEVMLSVDEVGETDAPITVPARQMSDGMLRMIAILTALEAGGGGVAIEGTASESPALTLVLEELENGLHPTQAANVLRLVKEASAEQGFQVVLTTHSPALLNALEGDDHPGVVVVARDRTGGRTEVTRLVDVPGYLAKMASSRLGDLVTSGRLAERSAEPGRRSTLDDLLGIA